MKRDTALVGENQPGRREGPCGFDPFVGTSAAIQQLAREAAQVVDATSPVLVLGETGTGKGVLARWIHESGPRRPQSFVDLNCAGISREFLESELFGHEKGAFTGAVCAKQGLLEVANGGTLFLDELGEMLPGVQAALLKVLEEKRFRRLGGVTDRVVSLRLVAATLHDVTAQAQHGAFRRDLYFRLSTIVLRLPPLRERPEDVVPLARELLERLAAERHQPVPQLSGRAMRRLEEHPWPGNVRELRNVLERALVVGVGGTIDAQTLQVERPAVPPVAPGWEHQTLVEVEREHIARVLALEQGNVERTARRLAIPRSTLYLKLRRYGLGRWAK